MSETQTFTSGGEALILGKKDNVAWNFTGTNNVVCVAQGEVLQSCSAATGSDTNTQTAGWTTSAGVWNGIDLNVNGKNIYVDKNLVVATNKFFVNGVTGNVGIGTTAPTAKLDVYRTPTPAWNDYTSAGQTIIRVGDATNYIKVGTSGQYTGLWYNTANPDPSNYIFQGGNDRTFFNAPAGDASYLSFRIGNATKMTVLGTGNVGIGTIAPATRLELQGTSATNILRLSSSDIVVGAGDIIGQLQFFSSDQTDYSGSSVTGVRAKIVAVDEGDGYGGYTGLAFYTARGGSATLSQKMSILSSGNVGIGTTAPATKLDVNGSAIIRNDSNLIGNVTLDGNIIYRDSYWDDITTSGLTGKTTGNLDPPVMRAFSGGIYTNQFINNKIEELMFSIQMSHTYKLDSNFDVHVHWSPMTSGTGDVNWCIEYTLADINSIYPASKTICSTTMQIGAMGTALRENLTSFGTLFKCSGLSCVIQARIFRNGGSYADYASLNSIDAHYELNSPGSRDKLAK